AIRLLIRRDPIECHTLAPKTNAEIDEISGADKSNDDEKIAHRPRRDAQTINRDQHIDDVAQDHAEADGDAFAKALSKTGRNERHDAGTRARYEQHDREKKRDDRTRSHGSRSGKRLMTSVDQRPSTGAPRAGS